MRAKEVLSPLFGNFFLSTARTNWNRISDAIQRETEKQKQSDRDCEDEADSNFSAAAIAMETGSESLELENETSEQRSAVQLDGGWLCLDDEKESFSLLLGKDDEAQ